MKARFLLILFVLLALVLPSFAQDVTEEVPFSPPEVVAPAPESAGDLPAYVESMDFSSPWVWGGWMLSVLMGGGLIYFASVAAKNGNSQAQFALRVFEASRDMLPVDKLQLLFEQKAALSPSPIDDYMASVSRSVLEKLGLMYPNGIPVQTLVELGIVEEVNLPLKE